MPADRIKCLASALFTQHPPKKTNTDLPTMQDNGYTSSTEVQSIIRQAIRSVVDAPHEHIIRYGSEPNLPCNCHPSDIVNHRHDFGEHKHSFTEFTIAASGPLIMEFDGIAYTLEPPGFTIAQPGHIHCEGFSDKRQPYTVMILAFWGKSVIASVTHYHGKGTWATNYRKSLIGSQIQSLSDRLRTKRKILSPSDLEGIRADILLILAVLYGQSCHLLQHEDEESHYSLLNSIRSFMEDHIDKQLSLEQLAAMAHLSPNYFNNIFAEQFGIPVRQYLVRRRMELADQLLRSSDSVLVKEVAHQLGYRNPLYFSRAFHKHFGYSPRCIVGQRELESTGSGSDIKD